MEKKYLLVLMVIFLAFTTGCRDAEEENKEENVLQYEMEVQDLSWDDLVSSGNCIVIATYKEFHAYENYVEYEFSVSKVLHGRVDEMTIFVYSLPASAVLEDTNVSFYTGMPGAYEIGEEYLLLLEKRESIFYEHDRYILPANLIMPCGDLEKSTIYGQSLQEFARTHWHMEQTFFSDIKELATSMIEEISFNNVMEINELGEFEYTLKVSVDEFLHDAATHNGKVYKCKVLEVVSGGLDKNEVTDEIYYVALPGLVDIGNIYEIEVERMGKESNVFCALSPNSVMMVNE